MMRSPGSVCCVNQCAMRAPRSAAAEPSTVSVSERPSLKDQDSTSPCSRQRSTQLEVSAFTSEFIATSQNGSQKELEISAFKARDAQPDRGDIRQHKYRNTTAQDRELAT